MISGQQDLICTQLVAYDQELPLTLCRPTQMLQKAECQIIS